MPIRKLLVPLFLLIGFVANGQPWYRNYHFNNAAYYWVPDFTYNDVHGGIFVAGYQDPISPGDSTFLVRIDRYGNVLWQKNADTTSFSSFSTIAALTNGDYLLGIDSNTNTNYYIVRRIDSNGNILFNNEFNSIAYNSWTVNFQEISPQVLASNTGGYYVLYPWDSNSYNSIANVDTLYNRTRIEKYGSNNLLIWRNTDQIIHWGTSSNVHDDSRIDRSSAKYTYDDGLVYCKYIYADTNRLLIERINANGNKNWSVNLYQLLNIDSNSASNTNLGSVNIFCSSDSSFIIRCCHIFQTSSISSADTGYLLKLDKNGNLLLSTVYATYDSAYQGLLSNLEDNGVETSTGKYLFSSYIILSPPNQTNPIVNWGFTEYDRNLNFISFTPNPLNEAGYSKLIANSSGGAFTAFGTSNNFNASNNHLVATNFDSSFNTYPNSVSGNIVLDNNSNCATDAGDLRIRNTPVVLDDAGNQSWYAFSNDTGYYKANIPTGNYAQYHTIYGYKAPECPAGGGYSYSITTPTQYTNKNFYDTLIPNISDLSLNVYTACSFVPGFDNQVYLVANNIGTVTANPTLTFIIDPSLSFVSSVPAPSGVSGNTLTYNLSNLYADSSQSVTITLHTPTTATIGAPLQFSADLPFANDLNLSNNVDTLIDTVRSSYDPNDKTVNRPLYFDPNKEMVYSVEFQNTGTYYARNVVVVDPIDSRLDLSTFHLLSGSPFMPAISWWDGNRLMFNFNNINLPDSAMSPTASIGHFAYSIRAKGNVHVGDTVRNSAYIYFDFNKAVATDTTINIVKIQPNAIALVPPQAEIKLYPNPSSGEITIMLPKNSNGNWQVSVSDISGRLVSSNSYPQGNNAIQLKLDAASGIYFIRIANLSTHEAVVKKLVLQR